MGNPNESGMTQGDRLNAIKASRRIQSLSNTASAHKQVTPVATNVNSSFSFDAATAPSGYSTTTMTRPSAANYTTSASVDLTNVNAYNRGQSSVNTRRSAAMLVTQTSLGSSSTNTNNNTAANTRVSPVTTHTLPKGIYKKYRIIS